MRLQFLPPVTLLATLVLVAPLQAYDEVDLETFTQGLPVCQGCDLTDADLSDRDFQRAKLRQSDLTDANLSDSDFTSGFFTCAVLERADLRDATFQWGNFVDADLRGANLKGANLSNTDLTGAQLAGVLIDEHTRFDGAKLPDGVTLYDGTQNILRVPPTRTQEQQRIYCESRKNPR